MTLVKQVFLATALLFSMVGSGYIRPVHDVRSNIASDGEYIGLSRMPNLSPEEPDVAWYHENTLVIRNDEAILNEVPLTIRHGTKEYSAADGGFLTYRARFIVKDGHNVIEMRLVKSMYIMFPKDKHNQYVEIKTYPVKFVGDQIELLGVRYRTAVLKKTSLDSLLNLLSAEPLEKNEAGL